MKLFLLLFVSLIFSENLIFADPAGVAPKTLFLDACIWSLKDNRDINVRRIYSNYIAYMKTGGTPKIFDDEKAFMSGQPEETVLVKMVKDYQYISQYMYLDTLDRITISDQFIYNQLCDKDPTENPTQPYCNHICFSSPWTESFRSYDPMKDTNTIVLSDLTNLFFQRRLIKNEFGNEPIVGAYHACDSLKIRLYEYNINKPDDMTYCNMSKRIPKYEDAYKLNCSFYERILEVYGRWLLFYKSIRERQALKTAKQDLDGILNTAGIPKETKISLEQTCNSQASKFKSIISDIDFLSCVILGEKGSMCSDKEGKNLYQVDKNGIHIYIVKHVDEDLKSIRSNRELIE